MTSDYCQKSKGVGLIPRDEGRMSTGALVCWPGQRRQTVNGDTKAECPPVRLLARAAQTDCKRARFLFRAFGMAIGSTCGLQVYSGVLWAHR